MVESEQHMKSREFLGRGLAGAGGILLLGGRGFEAAEHRYKLAPENLLPADVRRAPAEDLCDGRGSIGDYDEQRVGG